MERKRAPGAGRKPYFGEPMAKLICRLPIETIEKIDQAANYAGEMAERKVNRSHIVRAALDDFKSPEEFADVYLASCIGDKMKGERGEP